MKGKPSHHRCFYLLLKHGTHLFFITGESVNINKVLINTNTYTKVRTYELVDNDDMIEDDRFFPTMWFVKFNNGNFEIIYKEKMIDNR